MFAAFIPGPDAINGWTCKIVDTYEEAQSLANEYYQNTGIIVAVEEVKKPEFAGNYEGPLYAPHPDLNNG
jgi:hypothetical protein